jgi:glycosyltransferase involved in cell wall biosynthesis
MNYNVYSMNFKVSVIMPVFNSDKYLRESIDSTIHQTFSNFELIIINDGSEDDSEKIIKSFADARIRYIKHPENKGLIYTRNEALRLSNGQYIAFLDSDDIAIPQRIERQVAFLESNPDFGMVGSWVKTIDENGIVINNCIKHTAKPEVIPVILLFKNYFTTSSVMVRKSCLPDAPFDQDFPIAEDYNLWIKIAERSKVWNLQEVLTCYRLHNENIHKQLYQKMRELDMLQLTRQLSKFKINFAEEEYQIFFLIGKLDYLEEHDLFFKTEFEFIDRTFNKLIKANLEVGKFDPKIFFDYLNSLWSQFFITLFRYNVRLFFSIVNSAFYRNLSIKIKVKFIFKCLIHFSKQTSNDLR